MSSTDSGNIFLFLDLCASIEELFADLYHFYSRVYADNPDAARVWKKLAIEEENHRAQVELAAHLQDEVAGLEEGVLERSHLLHKKLQLMLRGVKSCPPPLDIALKKAVEMEESLAGLHVDRALSFKTESTQKLFHALREADRSHVSALKRQLAIETLAITEMMG